jgi:hypothetical protein
MPAKTIKPYQAWEIPRSVKKLGEWDVFVMDGQVHVCAPDESFNDIQAIHCRQGFAFRPGCLTIIPDYQEAEVKLTVFHTPEPAFCHLAERALLLPWVLDKPKALNLHTVGASKTIRFGKRTASVLYEIYEDHEERQRINVYFIDSPAKVTVVRDDGAVGDPMLCINSKPLR